VEKSGETTGYPLILAFMARIKVFFWRKQMKSFTGKLILFFAALSMTFILPGRLFAQENLDLDKIVVTASRNEQQASQTSASITIITQEDIKAANASNIPELFKARSSVNVKDYYGNGTKASVDILGFGEMAPQNTLVLVDGRRVNEIDLSGVDWTQIPLETVERVEIIRGKGAVLYGDNAANGVINIITKKGSGKPSLEFEAKAGSFDLEKQRLSLSGAENKFSYFLNASREFTNGYRDNSDFSSQDISSKLTLQASELLDLDFAWSYHDADYGMPGALRESQLLTRGRRETLFPLDTAGEKDWYAALGSKFALAQDIALDTGISFRRRRLDNQQLSSQSIDGRKIDTFGFTPSVTLSQPLLEKPNKLIIGYDLYRVDSINDAYSYSGAAFYQGEKTRTTDIDKDNYAMYAQDQVSLSEKLIANAGYRFDKTRYTFLSLPQQGAWTADPWWTGTIVNDLLTVKKSAIDLGLSYIYRKNSNIFFDYSRNFRLPTTDEYYSLWADPPVNINLKTQTANYYTAGINHSFNKKVKAKLSLFTMSVRNELYYDPNPLTSSNTNYDKTLHRGLETECEFAPNEKVTVLSGYAFTEAFFNGGTYNHNQIPMVPRHKVFAKLSVKPNAAWNISTVAQYNGRKYFINDQSNSYSPLKDYLTVDARIAYNLKKGSVYIGINNIFDSRYSDYGAISTVYNEKGYYPAPGRNIVTGASLKF
jgi:iron complex outermembrane receptor protein